MLLSSDKFAAWMIDRFALYDHRKANGDVIFAGNYQQIVFACPVRNHSENKEEFDVRVREWRSELPRANTFPEVLAMAYEAFVKDGRSHHERPASRLLELIRRPLMRPDWSTGLKARGVRHTWRRSKPVVGGSLRARRKKRKVSGVSREARAEARLRTSYARFKRECPNFPKLFETWYGRYRSECVRDSEWYSKLEESYSQTLRLREKTYGPNDYQVAAMRLALASLYHAQSKFGQAEECYWQTWRICLGEPTLTTQFRSLLLQEIATGIGRSREGLPPSRTPTFSGARLFVRLGFVL